VAFAPNLSTAVSLVAWGLPFHQRDLVLTIDQEFPSNVYPWRAVATAKNLRLETFTSRPDLSIDWDHFLTRIRPGIRAVVLSWVQYKAGTTAPLHEISAACRRVGAWLIVDAIQGLGVMPFDLVASGADVICGGTHKWLCGFTGQAFMAFRDDLFLEMTPVIAGARTYGGPEVKVTADKEPVATASRFEAGSATHLASIPVAASVEVLIRHGIPEIGRVSGELADRLRRGIHGKGYTILGDQPGTPTSPLVCFRDGLLRDLSEKLTEHRVSHVLREHGLRLSPHAFNTTAEVDQVLALIPPRG
jgi:selenocysteine lyase/cysteine desulfurase